jgi:hypothetical protein
MTDDENMNDIRAWLREPQSEPAPVLDLPAVIRAGLRRRRQRRALAGVGSAVAAVAVVAVVSVGWPSITPDGPTDIPATTTTPHPTPNPGGLLLRGRCIAGHLSVHLGAVGGTAGTFYHAVSVHNDGQPCRLPRLAQVAFTGGQLGSTRLLAGTYDGPVGRPLQLDHGATVTFQIAVTDPTNYPAGCGAKTPSRVLVTVPSNAQRSTQLPWHAPICTSPLGATVGPLVR